MIGFSLLSSAFMNYCGSFTSDVKCEIVKNWVAILQTNNIPYTYGLNSASLMSDSSQNAQMKEINVSIIEEELINIIASNMNKKLLINKNDYMSKIT